MTGSQPATPRGRSASISANPFFISLFPVVNTGACGHATIRGRPPTGLSRSPLQAGMTRSREARARASIGPGPRAGPCP